MYVQGPNQFKCKQDGKLVVPSVSQIRAARASFKVTRTRRKLPRHPRKVLSNTIPRGRLVVTCSSLAAASSPRQTGVARHGDLALHDFCCRKAATDEPHKCRAMRRRDFDPMAERKDAYSCAEMRCWSAITDSSASSRIPAGLSALCSTSSKLPA